MVDKYHVFFKESANEYTKMEIESAPCKINFRFAGAGLGNVQTIIDDKRSGFNHHIYFVPSKKKLSNMGESIYISRQRIVDIITKNDTIIWSRFEGDKDERKIINHYLRVSKTK